MKYGVVIIDGAAGHPLPEHGGKTSLELAATPNLDALAAGGTLGLARTVPPGMEPSSACACMSVLGYDPVVYYKGRAAIEAKSVGIDIAPGEVIFRCNLVTVTDGIMTDYSGGHISTAEAREIVATLNEKLGGDDVIFYPGSGYRQYVKLRGRPETAHAICIGPHDIPDKPVEEYLPHGEGSKFIRNLMRRSGPVLRDHPVNKTRRERGESPVTTIWLVWGSGPVPEMPAFREVYGLTAAMTSGVDLLRGMARMADIKILEIPGVTDGPDNDYVAQAEGAIAALKNYDLVVIHIESPDEASHGGHLDEKIRAIEAIDKEVIGRLRQYR
ncbi:MAG: cofactor-independent phosphoglycerate mutase, partial [Dehalococcoidales bacterium]|nr:cofactor-independent phosphoglycerate mutase [Dehalococcoidales bacterium]